MTLGNEFGREARADDHDECNSLTRVPPCRSPSSSPQAAENIKRYVAPQPLSALDRPNIMDVIKRFEHWDILWKTQPWHFAARKNMNIRLNGFRMIERPDANQQGIARRRIIFAPQVCATSATEQTAPRWASETLDG
jgi:hypothetical protein